VARNKSLLLSFAFSMLAFPVFSVSLDDLVDQRLADSLRAAQEAAAPEPSSQVASPLRTVTYLQMKSPVPHFLPRHVELERFVLETISGMEPNILVETLSLYKLPRASQKTADSAGWSRSEQTGLLNQLLALSTLTGIQYYSESRRAMRVFYESSLVIEEPVRKKPMPDPLVAVCPDSLVIYARQKDLTFGDNVYRFEYHTDAGIIFFSQENINSMNAGIIPAIGKNNFRTVMAVIDLGDSLLVYGAAMAKTASLPGMSDRIGSSFTNRVKAILKWFVGKADGVFG
jgi:hypothetical protein